MYSAQAQLADACLYAGRGREAPIIGDDLVAREPWDSANIARFYDTQKTPFHVESRGAEWFPKFYGIVHPGEQWATDRNVRLGAAHALANPLTAREWE